jgi:hypothetical protein
MWSVGCICAELYLGLPLFPGNDSYDQLDRIIKFIGHQPEDHHLQQAQPNVVSKFFSQEGQVWNFKNRD